MSEAHKKTRQPEVVRRNLLDATAQVIVSQGFAGMSLNQIVKLAGVSKGALFHHFENKQVLVEALLQDLLKEFDRQIDNHIALDNEPRGRFLRAYLHASLMSEGEPDAVKSLGAMTLATSHNDALAAIWRNWLQGRICRHPEEFQATTGLILRHAIDGIWLEDCENASVYSPAQRKEIIKDIIKKTYEL